MKLKTSYDKTSIKYNGILHGWKNDTLVPNEIQNEYDDFGFRKFATININDDDEITIYDVSVNMSRYNCMLNTECIPEKNLFDS